MSALIELSTLLNDKEKREFVSYLQGRNKRKDVKNIELFKAVFSGNTAKLKKKLGSNAYNVLSKRLTDTLIDFIAAKSVQVDVSNEIQVLRIHLVAKKLFIEERFKIGFKMLAKAESEAIRLNQFSQLNEIYHTMIAYSFHHLAPDIDETNIKFLENNKRFAARETLNLIYATIKKAYLDAQHKGEEIDLESLLEEQFSKYHIDSDILLNYETLYQLAVILDIAGSSTRSYHSIDLFFEEKISELESSPDETEASLLYYIDLLYILANIYFRKKQFEMSLDFLGRMHDQMIRLEKFKTDIRMDKYITVKALNLNYLGNHIQAAQILDARIKNKGAHSGWMPNVLITRAMIHIQQNELKEAKGIIAKFQHSDLWYERNFGLEWVLNKKFIELILHIEFGDIDLVESRLNSLSRKYSGKLKNEGRSQALPFLKVLRRYFKDPEQVHTDEFKNYVRQNLEIRSKEEADILLLSFYAWIRAKIENRGLYEVTLSLIN